MIVAKYKRLFSRAAIATCFCLAMPGSGSSANPLLTRPMPICARADGRFEDLLRSLQLRRAWKGTHRHHPGELELMIARDGRWFLFSSATDRREQKLTCLIARGVRSQEWFGRPV